MKKQPNSKMCYACGVENRAGLHLHFYEDESGQVVVKFTPEDAYQGYPGVLHGGIICTLLDETIGRALLSDDYWAATGKLEIRFLQPVPLRKPLTVTGRVTRPTRRAAEGTGEIRLQDGTIAAEGKALYIRLPDDQVDEFKDQVGSWEVVPEE
jgi:uncharacterized protein (TIGR00369 family)